MSDWLIQRSYVMGVAAFLVLYTVDTEESILYATAPSLFLVTILELARNRRLHAAAFLRNHMAEFLTHDDLQSAFYDLIYTYSEKEWEAALFACREEVSKYKDDIDIPTEIRDRVWEKLDPEGKRSVCGRRRYHPMFFQGSEEEIRLDKVLHHFSLIAHYWSRGAIDIHDISGVSGYYLSVIRARPVIRYYLDMSEEKWKLLPYEQEVGAEPPFKQLGTLLEDLQEWQMQRSSLHPPREEVTR